MIKSSNQDDLNFQKFKIEQKTIENEQSLKEIEADINRLKK